jgi:hypothetical protein
MFNQKKAKALLFFCEVRTDYLIELKKDAKENKRRYYKACYIVY